MVPSFPDSPHEMSGWYVFLSHSQMSPSPWLISKAGGFLPILNWNWVSWPSLTAKPQVFAPSHNLWNWEQVTGRWPDSYCPYPKLSWVLGINTSQIVICLWSISNAFKWLFLTISSSFIFLFVEMNCQAIHMAIILLMCQSAKGKIIETKINKSISGFQAVGVEKTSDYRGSTGNSLGWWECSMSLFGFGLHDYMHLSKLIKLYIKKWVNFVIGSLYLKKSGFRSSHCGLVGKGPDIVSMRTQVWSLVSLSGLSIQHYCKLWSRSQMQLRFGIAVAVVQTSAVALIFPLAWELPYATGVVIQRKKGKKEREREGGRNEERILVFQ